MTVTMSLKTQLTGASIVTAAFLIALTSLIIPCTAAATEKYAAGDRRAMRAVPPIPNRGRRGCRFED